jgi:DNA polymerase III subunit alpha
LSYVPLHLHSEYSILNSTLSIDAVVAKAKDNGCQSLAITDEGNLFGAVEFFNACTKAGIKPIIGCELRLAPESRHDKKRSSQGLPPSFSLILLAKSIRGYKNLCLLSSTGYVEGFYYTPRIDFDFLSCHSEDLICITGDPSSCLSYYIVNGKLDDADKEVQRLKELFKDDLYFEVQRFKMSDERLDQEGISKEPFLLQGYKELVANSALIESHIVDFSNKYQIPVIASVDVHYLEPSDWKAHEILKNIQSGEPCEIWEKDSQGNLKNKIPNPKREVMYSHEYDFKSFQQIQALFADHPEWIENTLKVAEKCNVKLDFKTKHYPVYTPPELRGQDTSEEIRAKAAADYLKNLCYTGIPKRYTPERIDKLKELFPDQEPLDMVNSRLAYELELIISKGMGDYLLIVWDFIHWAKTSGIPVGPGRGSGAGSIILFLIGITDIEPLRFNLFFERFINPERLSYPDIDVDICMDRRGEVIQYMIDTYGQDKVAQIITFGTMKAKMAIKDVGRVLSVPLAKVNQIAKLIPDDLSITIEKALDVDPDLKQQYEADSETKILIDLAKKLEGSVRNTGIHAAGLIVSAVPLMQTVPVCVAKDSDMLVTQFSMKPVEAVGMLKIDFLGLKTLTSIQEAVRLVNENTQSLIDWVDLPLDNKATFDLLNQGKTMGVFQLESGGMQDLARQLHIDRFEEIIAVGALYRPGPMEMIPSFIQRKHGLEAIEIDHPLMKEILAETYGIMVYQEQVMQIASKLAGYSLGEGDVLRRAMGKKDKDEMARQRVKFKDGALQNNIDEATSMKIFDKVEKFASYGFNKSHAAAYGYLSYVTAYLKANHSKEWMAALMTCDRDDLSKVTKVIHECQSMNIPVLGPDINQSTHVFKATSESIRFALSAIKGVGETVIEHIVEERQARGLYADIFDFFKRVDIKKIGKKTLECLVDAGAFDSFGMSRDLLAENLESLISKTLKQKEDASRGILSLFESIEDDDLKNFKFVNPKLPRSKIDILKREYELLGFYLRGHPLDDYRSLPEPLQSQTIQQIQEMTNPSVIQLACIIESVTLRISAKSQKKFAILNVGDGHDRMELPVWPEAYEAHAQLIKENQLLFAVLLLDKEEQGLKVQVKGLYDLTQLNDQNLASIDQLIKKTNGFLKKSEKPNYRNFKSEEKMQKKKWILSFDINSLSLGRILTIKDIFRSHPGQNPVDILFFNDKKKLAEVQIESNWGVSDKMDWVDQVKNCPGLLQIEYQEIS